MSSIGSIGTSYSLRRNSPKSFPRTTLSDTPGVLAQLTTEMGEGRLTAFEILKDRLLTAPSNPFYTSVAAVRDHWQKLRADYIAPAKVPELGLATEVKFTLQT